VIGGKTNRKIFSVIAGGRQLSAQNRESVYRDTAGLEAVATDAAAFLAAQQQEDGHWVFDLEADVTIPSEYVMLQRFIGREIAPEVAERLTAYLLERQMPDGSWPLYAVDGNANISASVKAYFALKLLGHDKNAPHMVKARRTILALGGRKPATSLPASPWPSSVRCRGIRHRPCRSRSCCCRAGSSFT